MLGLTRCGWLIAALFWVTGTVQAATETVTTTTTATTTTTETLPPVADLSIASNAFAQAQDSGRAGKIAVYVRNRAGASEDGASAALEGMVMSSAAQAGLQVISRQDVLASVSRLSERGDSSAQAEVMGADLLLEQSASSLRLAEMMGADYVLVVNLAERGVKSQTVNRADLGINRTVKTHKLIGSFYVADAVYGSTLYGGPLKAAARTSATGDGSYIETDNTLESQLYQDAADQLAGALAGVVLKSLPNRGKVRFEVAVGVSDLSIPDVVKNDDGEWVITDTRFTLVPIGVTAELDGVAIGSTPGTFLASPGLHRLRLTREGFKPWERMVNLVEGQGDPFRLEIAMTLTDDAIDRMQAIRTWLDRAQRGKILTDADVEVLEGLAELLRNANINIDTSGLRSVGGDRRILEIDSYIEEVFEAANAE